MSKIKRRIGMLDSGLGGLTVLSALRAMITGVDIVYIADTAHVPYGDRSLAQVAELGARMVKRLLVHEPLAIVVASGTTSAAFDAMGWPQSPVPLVDVVGPGARSAVASTSNGVVGVVATNATVKSGIFERKILELRPDAVVKSVGAPALVPIVESGQWASARAREAVSGYCASFLRSGCDTVVLGCTHFPHLSAWFGAALGPQVRLVDPGAACAQDAVRLLAGSDPLPGHLRFEVSGDVEDFGAKATLLSGMRVDALEKVRISLGD